MKELEDIVGECVSDVSWNYEIVEFANSASIRYSWRLRNNEQYRRSGQCCRLRLEDLVNMDFQDRNIVFTEYCQVRKSGAILHQLRNLIINVFSVLGELSRLSYRRHLPAWLQERSLRQGRSFRRS